MSAPATNDLLARAGQDHDAHRLVAACSSSIARRSSSSVCAFSALRTLGRLIVTIADRAVALEQQVVEAMAHQSGNGYISQPSTSADSEEAAEHQPAEAAACSRGIVLGDHREHERHEEREQRHQQEVALHYFRPSATS